MFSTISNERNMANQKKLEGQVELNCSAKKLFEQIMAKLPDIHNICTSKVAKIEVHEDACTCVGSVRRWDCIIGNSDFLANFLWKLLRKSLSCKRPYTFKLKLDNDKSNIKKRISPIVTRLISFGD